MPRAGDPITFTANDRCSVFGKGMLQPGDVIELDMDKLGTQRQVVPASHELPHH